MIKYKMWNRVVNKYPKVEIILYDDKYKYVGKIHTTNDYANTLLAEWVAPVELYYKTNGTMGR